MYLSDIWPMHSTRFSEEPPFSTRKQQIIEKQIIEAVNDNDDKRLFEIYSKFHFNANMRVSAGDHLKFTLLTYACSKGNQSNSIYNEVDARVIRTLLQMGAQVNMMDGNRCQAIHWAAKSGNVEFLDELIYHVDRSGNDLQRKPCQTRNAFRGRGEPIELCVPLNHFHGNINTVAKPREEYDPQAHLQLLKVRLHASDGWTPLHCTAAHMEAIEYLINHGAEVNAADVHGWTHLHHMSGCARLNVVIQLLCAGAHANLLDDGERSAIDWALSRGRGGLPRFREDTCNFLVFLATRDYLEYFARLHPKMSSRKRSYQEMQRGFMYKHVLRLKDVACKITEECDMFYVNETLLKHLTTFFVQKMNQDTNQYAFFSRIYENNEFVEEMFDDDYDF